MMREKRKMLLNPNWVRSITPIKGPMAVAMTTLMLKYPMPSPLLEVGMICETMVLVAVVARPIAKPCRNLSTISG